MKEEIKNDLEKEVEEIKSMNNHNDSEATKIVSAVEDASVVLFRNELNEPYANISFGTHKRSVKIESKDFKSWLSKLIWDKNKKVIPTATRINVIETLAAKALCEGKTLSLHNRTAWHDGSLWYDIGDGKTIVIDKDDWRVETNPPIIFRNFKHQKSQTLPSDEGDATKLLDFINIRDDEKRLVLLVWIISCFIPDFPHPILCIHGPQGSAKTTLCKIIKEIIDPSQLDVVSFPGKEAELIQQLSHNWCMAYDNVSYISGEQSDILCRAVTGASYSKRSLYTDDEDFIYRYKRCLIINGINELAGKPDLMERSLLVETEPLTGTNSRRRETSIFREFEEARPIILSGIFDCLSKTLQRNKTESESEFRMCDFVSWGCAISESLGYEASYFKNAYLKILQKQNEEVLNSNLVAVALQSILSIIKKWEGTASSLLVHLEKNLIDNEIDFKRDKFWPKTPTQLSRRITELKTDLNKAGIEIRKEKKGRERVLVLEQKEKIETIDDGDDKVIQF
jgi:hypothetical protein